MDAEMEMEHNTGVDTRRDHRGPSARGVCDCGWRGLWRFDEMCGFDAADDVTDHRREIKSGQVRSRAAKRVE